MGKTEQGKKREERLNLNEHLVKIKGGSVCVHTCALHISRKSAQHAHNLKSTRIGFKGRRGGGIINVDA